MEVQQVFRRTLVIGAGAVGKVFAHTLRDAGSDVSLFVKPEHVPRLKDGFNLYALHRWRRWHPRPEAPYTMLTDIDEVAEQWWDIVVLAVSATAVRGEWLEEILKAVGQAPVLTIQPGVDAHERVAALVSADRLLSLMVSFIAFEAPLSGCRDVEPGLAYWYPPMSPSLISGPEMLVEAVQSLLRAGRMPVRLVGSALAAESQAAAMLMVFLAALETRRWDLDALDAATLDRVARGAREAHAVVARRLKLARPLLLSRLNGFWLRVMVVVARRTFPFNVEAYLRYHFTKVGDQTRVLLDSYVNGANTLGLSCDELRAFREELRACDESQGEDDA